RIGGQLVALRERADGAAQEAAIFFGIGGPRNRRGPAERQHGGLADRRWIAGRDGLHGQCFVDVHDRIGDRLGRGVVGSGGRRCVLGLGWRRGTAPTEDEYEHEHVSHLTIPRTRPSGVGTQTESHEAAICSWNERIARAPSESSSRRPKKYA